MPRFEGGCLCGRMRYPAGELPHAPHYCHCRMCQRVVGAPVVAWVNFPRTAFSFTAAEPAFYQSSPGIRRGFCPACGSSLCTIVEDRDDHVCVTIATLDDPAAIAPGYHIWTESQLPWLNLAGDLPRRLQ